MSKKRIITALFLLVCIHNAGAQFVIPGDEPGSVRWNEIRSRNYRVVYPVGMDSLARTYILSLETYRNAVGVSLGFIPNQNYRNPMPVVLHPYSVQPNGSVSWAPRIMNLITTPEWSSPLPLPETDQLSIHESRHVAQMQFCNWRGFKVPSVIFGQLWAGAMCAVYPGQALLEGDAVVAETELTFSGRGRNADFLEYYRASAAAGEKRDFWQWRYGSQKRYTPDYYRAGYVLVAGMRDVFDCPDFSEKYYMRIFRKGLPFWNLQKTVKEASGLKFKDAFSRICDSLYTGWEKDRIRRAPFIPAVQITDAGALYTDFNRPVQINGELYGIRRGIAESAALVRTDGNGRTKKIMPFSPVTSALAEDTLGTIFWSEVRPDIRYEMRSFSDVFTSDTLGHKTRITRRQRYFNPSPNADGSRISVTLLPPEGGSSLVILDRKGTVLKSVTAPDSLQLVESVWRGEELFASGVSHSGIGIYRAEETGFSEVVAPIRATVKRLFCHDGAIYFTSDLSSVNELYRLDPDDGIRRISNTPDGANDFRFSANSDTLFYTRLLPEGRLVFATPCDSLQSVPVWTATAGTAPISAKSRNPEAPQSPTFPQAEKLTSQFNDMAEGLKSPELALSEPKRYSKIGNAIRIHSWAPVFVDIDRIQSLSAETFYQSAGLGATMFFQNDLGTFSGAAGVRINVDDIRRTGGYAKFTYSGLFPVMELSVSGNMRDATMSKPDTLFSRGCGNVEGKFSTYIPFNFSGGGWRRGIVPKASVTVNNDIYTDMHGHERNYMIINAGIRGYIMQYVAPSCLYPRWGIGAETGYSRIPDVDPRIGRNFFGYLYGYLPGLLPTHGVKLAAYGSSRQAYVSLDYAVPFAPVDWSALSPVVYIRNFEFIPHIQYNWTYGYVSAAEASLPAFRFGADIVIRMSNLLWIPFDTRLGVRVRNTGVEMIFGIEL